MTKTSRKRKPQTAEGRLSAFPADAFLLKLAATYDGVGHAEFIRDHVTPMVRDFLAERGISADKALADARGKR